MICNKKWILIKFTPKSFFLPRFLFNLIEISFSNDLETLCLIIVKNESKVNN